MYSFAVEVPRVYEESLGRGRQSVAHGVVAAITDARAVDDMTAKLGSGLADGSRQRARRFLFSDASALKRARVAAAATEWMRKERLPAPLLFWRHGRASRSIMLRTFGCEVRRNVVGGAFRGQREFEDLPTSTTMGAGLP